MSCREQAQQILSGRAVAAARAHANLPARYGSSELARPDDIARFAAWTLAPSDTPLLDAAGRQ